MALTTYSAFVYGHTIDDSNNMINFSEDGLTELTAVIDIGSYTLGDFVNKVAEALNDVGGQEYSVTLDRTTRKITIESLGNFWLYPVTGSNSSTSAYQLIGFTTDRSGDNEYEADIASGFIYYPQTPLASFVDFKHNVKYADSKVNESASGAIEVVSYGIVKYMECVIPFITNIINQMYIKNDVNGVENAEQFLNYLITKAPIEFIYDVDDIAFEKCLLESTEEDKNGTAFRLKELYARKLIGYFTTGKLVFRSLE